MKGEEHTKEVSKLLIYKTKKQNGNIRNSKDYKTLIQKVFFFKLKIRKIYICKSQTKVISLGQRYYSIFDVAITMVVDIFGITLHLFLIECFP